MMSKTGDTMPQRVDPSEYAYNGAAQYTMNMAMQRRARAIMRRQPQNAALNERAP